MEEKATEKQIKFMKQLGIKNWAISTKQEARALIEKKLNEPNGDAKPEVRKMHDLGPDRGYDPTVKEKPKDNGFHLTPENCRLGALSCAVESVKGSSYSDEVFWQVVKRYEKYIVTGK